MRVQVLGDVEDYWLHREWWDQHNELASLLDGISSRSDTSNDLLKGIRNDINQGFDRLDDGIYNLQATLYSFINEYRGDQALKAELERQRFEFMLQWDAMTIPERKAFLLAREKQAKARERMTKLRARKEELRQIELTKFNEQFQKRWLRKEHELKVRELSPERIAERKERAEQHAANFAKNQARREERNKKILEERTKQDTFIQSDPKLKALSLFSKILNYRFFKILFILLGLIPWWFIAQQNLLLFVFFLLPIGITGFGLSALLSFLRGKLLVAYETRAKQVLANYRSKNARGPRN